MGKALSLHGMEIFRKVSVGDSLTEITTALRQLLADSDVVLVTGGLGPTRDDVTKKALCEYFGTGMTFSEDTWHRLERFFNHIGRSTTEAHREQCFMPANALLLTNKMGTAPGMWMEEAGKIVISMPGVPYEMEYLMTEEVIPRLEKKFQLPTILHRTLLTAGEGESRLAVQIEDIEDSLPPHLKLAYLPSLGHVRLRLSGRSHDRAQLEKEITYFGDAIRERVAPFIYGEGDSTLEIEVGKMLQARGWVVATAESCTGGYLAHRITSVPGSSGWFHGSIIAYDNRIKEQLLGVSPETLRTHGAVSEATVREMVAGAVRILGVDVAVATSGIAGPTGGTEDKPVGTIWLAVGNGQRTITQLVKGTKNREKNIEFATARALALLWKWGQEAGA
ncbi:MAG: CinA family nicotinamide mononucleotide deamidase-related protein [Saprospiraceae bacterium]